MISHGKKVEGSRTGLVGEVLESPVELVLDDLDSRRSAEIIPPLLEDAGADPSRSFLGGRILGEHGSG